MHTGSAQFSNSPSVWVFWPSQPIWPSQTRFPMQWLQKSTMVIFAPGMPRTNIAVLVSIGWSQLLSSRAYYYFLLTLAIIFNVRSWYFWHFSGSMSMSSHHTILPCLRTLLCSQLAPVLSWNEDIFIFMIFRGCATKKWTRKSLKKSIWLGKSRKWQGICSDDLFMAPWTVLQQF